VKKENGMTKNVLIFNPELEDLGTLAKDILHPETHEVWFEVGHILTWGDLVSLVSMGVDMVQVEEDTVWA
jgi:hypothetical protein